MDKVTKAVDELINNVSNRRRNIKERRVRELILDLSDVDQDIPNLGTDEIFDLTLNGPMVVPTTDDIETPLPWDADFSIKGDDLIMHGGAGPHGWGSAVVKVPKSDVKPNGGDFKFILEPKDGESVERLKEILNNWGIGYRIS